MRFGFLILILDVSSCTPISFWNLWFRLIAKDTKVFEINEKMHNFNFHNAFKLRNPGNWDIYVILSIFPNLPVCSFFYMRLLRSLSKLSALWAKRSQWNLGLVWQWGADNPARDYLVLAAACHFMETFVPFLIEFLLIISSLILYSEKVKTTSRRIYSLA